MLNIPNILTLIRLMLVPLCAMYLYKEQFLAALIIYVVASLTDIADGYIARRFDIVTNFGKVVDPLADKLLSLSTITILSYRGRIHILVPILIFVKELLIGLGGLLLYKKKHLVKSAKWYGKATTVLLFVSIVLVMFKATLFVGRVFMVVALGFAYFALFMYLRQFVGIMTREKGTS
ncbi:MAG TPA: CDP-diacylglycerol--glycerol-3-phosphate 3-phosphatidyltransferase [Clostridiaceae bacterium]|nr:CDP-diacylglycerol--glycerol-3-phosphate 3-phosphatidyltransferase [Clostridiaceae bacterium]HOA31274.1 CDP-alcohol phosphatidyltransferase family protein [Clostridia bacterium]